MLVLLTSGAGRAYGVDVDAQVMRRTPDGRQADASPELVAGDEPQDRLPELCRQGRVLTGVNRELVELSMDERR